MKKNVYICSDEMKERKKAIDWLWFAFLEFQILCLLALGSSGCKKNEPYNPWGKDTPTLEVVGNVVYDSTEVVLKFMPGPLGGDTYLVHYIKSEFDFKARDVVSFQICGLGGENIYIPAKYIKVSEVHKGSFVMLVTDVTSGGEGGAYELIAEYEAVPWRPE